MLSGIFHHYYGVFMNLKATYNHDQFSAPPTDAVVGLRDRPEAGRPATPAAAVGPLLLNMKGLSQLLVRSEASLYRDDSAGRIPAGLKLGGSKRWAYPEIVAWVEAGMPSRRTWEAMKPTRYASAPAPVAGTGFRYGPSRN
jgi:predicted DNA-binding transcriptional regulator AlpA